MTAEKSPLFVGADWDFSLFDTGSFFYGHVVPLLEQYYPKKVEKHAFESQMDRFRRYFGPANDYDFFSHLAQLDIDGDEVERLISEKVHGNQFLLPGAQDFIEVQLANESDFNIVTLGEPRYQGVKIRIVPLVDGVPVHSIQEPKGPYVAREFKGKHGYLVDDAYIDGLPPEIEHHQPLSHKSKKYGEHTYTNMVDLMNRGPAELVQRH